MGRNEMLVLSAADRQRWEDRGCLVLRGHLPSDAVSRIQAWTDEIQGWPEKPGRWMKYFEAETGEKRLCRVENFYPYHEGFASLIDAPRHRRILDELIGEPAVLFKDKINFKLAGSSGFAPHQDAPAYTTFGQTFHVTLMVPVDPMTLENGCLETAGERRERSVLPQKPDGTLADAFVERARWQPLRVEPGDVVFFDSLLPHRSGPNRTAGPRRILYLTFNGASQGDHRLDYYAHKRKVFPPECERGPDWKPGAAAGTYNLGNPIR